MSSLPAANWRDAFKIYTNPRVVSMLFLGFSAGLPLLLVLGTLSFWLREAGIDRATIGFLSWIGLAYAFKWVWAPLVDRMPLPFLTRWLGRRRAWLLFAQCGIAAMLVGVALSDPQANLTQLVLFALAMHFFPPRRTSHWMPTVSKQWAKICRAGWPQAIRPAIASR